MKWINFLQRLLQRFFPKKNEIIEVKYIERDETRVLPDIPEKRHSCLSDSSGEAGFC
ncbi:hypothetical protein ACJ8CE_00870 [Klebsiella pneumoniae]